MQFAESQQQQVPFPFPFENIRVVIPIEPPTFKCENGQICLVGKHGTKKATLQGELTFIDQPHFLLQKSRSGQLDEPFPEDFDSNNIIKPIHPCFNENLPQCQCQCEKNHHGYEIEIDEGSRISLNGHEIEIGEIEGVKIFLIDGEFDLWDSNCYSYLNMPNFKFKFNNYSIQRIVPREIVKKLSEKH